ncbi:hypothetical protein Tco_0345337 [Tanacetum coccineum]
MVRHETVKLRLDDLNRPTGLDPDPENVNLEQEVACLMLSSMSPDLQRTMEKYNAYDMLKELKTMFEEQIKSYLDTLERLGYAMPNELGVSFILNSLNKDYDQFVQNYNMHNIGKTIAELHVMLKIHEKCIPKKAKSPAVLAIREDPKPEILPPPKRDNPTKDFVCHYYKEVGYWRRNCSSYKANLKKRNNVSMAVTLSIFTIKLYAFPNKTWVYDTGCGTHICNTLQGLKRSKKLKHRALSLYMGNGKASNAPLKL